MYNWRLYLACNLLKLVENSKGSGNANDKKYIKEPAHSVAIIYTHVFITTTFDFKKISVSGI